MEKLAKHIRETASLAEGYQVGRLIIENHAYLEIENKDGIDRVLLTQEHTIEIYNNYAWQLIKYEYLKRKTDYGWPLFAGFEARVKRK